MSNQSIPISRVSHAPALLLARCAPLDVYPELLTCLQHPHVAVVCAEHVLTPIPAVVIHLENTSSGRRAQLIVETYNNVPVVNFHWTDDAATSHTFATLQRPDVPLFLEHAFRHPLPFGKTGAIDFKAAPSCLRGSTSDHERSFVNKKTFSEKLLAFAFSTPLTSDITIHVELNELSAHDRNQLEQAANNAGTNFDAFLEGVLRQKLIDMVETEQRATQTIRIGPLPLRVTTPIAMPVLAKYLESVQRSDKPTENGEDCSLHKEQQRLDHALANAQPSTHELYLEYRPLTTRIGTTHQLTLLLHESASLRVERFCETTLYTLIDWHTYLLESLE